MECPSCRHDNDIEAKFCEQCAAPLTKACANCGSPASRTAKFCAECGHPLQPVAAMSLRALPRPGIEAMMEAVHRYEGTVNQVLGDGIMALFGAPLASEDHAVRACYAALGMQESVKRYAEQVQQRHGIPL